MGLADRLKAIESSQASAPPLQTVQNPQNPNLYNNGYQGQHQVVVPPNNAISTPPYQPPQYNYVNQGQPQIEQLPTNNVTASYQTPQHNYEYQKPPESINMNPTSKPMGFLSTLSQKFTGQSKTHTATPQIVHNTPGPYYVAVKQRIDAVIQDKNLHHFYPVNSPQYNNLLNRVSHVDFPSIAAKRKLPLELAFDLAALAVVDTILFCDDSGSMNFDENWNPSSSKTDDLKLILSRIVDIASLFDDDGMNIRFFNDNNVFDNIRTEQEAYNALSQVRYNGGTPIGKSLMSKVFEPLVYAKARNNTFVKPVMIYVITDGVPDNKVELKENIRTCKQWLSQTAYGKSAVNIMFAQVGNDQAAAQYLKQELDNDPEIGSDVDTTGNFEMEYMKYKPKGVDLTPDLWLLQMTLGSIVRSYDEGND